MKTILLILLAFPVLSFGQTLYDSIPVDQETSVVRFEKVIEASGDKDALYSKTKIWLSDIFKNSKSVIQTEDKSEGYITGKALLQYSYTHYIVKKKKIDELPNEPNRADFTFKIFVKDNKAKIIVSNIIIHGIMEFMNYEWSKSAMDFTQKQLTNEDLEEKVKGQTKEAEYRALINEITTIFASYQRTLQKKAESDF